MNKFFIVLISIFSLTACGLLPPAYKVPVSQGNVLEMKQVNQLELGMTESQVKYVLGTPMIRDLYKPNEWQYVFNVVDANETTIESEVSDLTLMFDQGKLIEIQGL